jgi:hypothetical protein
MVRPLMTATGLGVDVMLGATVDGTGLVAVSGVDVLAGTQEIRSAVSSSAVTMFLIFMDYPVLKCFIV